MTRRMPAPVRLGGFWHRCIDCQRRFWVESLVDLRRDGGRCAGCRAIHVEYEARRQVATMGTARPRYSED